MMAIEGEITQQLSVFVKAFTLLPCYLVVSILKFDGVTVKNDTFGRNLMK